MLPGRCFTMASTMRATLSRRRPLTQAAQPPPQQSASPLAAYRQLVETGKLQDDEGQLRVMERLEQLHQSLSSYRRPPVVPPVWLLKSATGRRVHDLLLTMQLPRGLYIYGDVGCGKTVLMDLFYDHAPPAVASSKRRTHFHSFMLDVHGRMHRWRKERRGDPLPDVARGIAQESLLLCFDEFQVSDVADALILRRLFENLFSLGCVMVATSNRHPKELYLGGLNREAAFVPFISLLQQRVAIERVGKEGDETKDYRREAAPLPQLYTVVTDAEEERRLARQAFQSLCQTATAAGTVSPPPGGGSGAREEVVSVMMGRKLLVPEAAHGVCMFDFQALCAACLGAADYLALAASYHAVVVYGVPTMTQGSPEARRMVTLIDILYESNCRLVVFARAPVEELFELSEFHIEGDADERTTDQLQQQPQSPPAAATSPSTVTGGDAATKATSGTSAATAAGSGSGIAISVLGEGGASSSKSSTYLPGGVEWSATGRKGVSLAELSGLQDTAFSFERCKSRLIEMQAQVYADRWARTVQQRQPQT